MSDNRILIVDDDRDFRESLGDILEMENYSVFLAHTKDEGIEILRNEKPHVALVDLHLGQTDGIEVIQDFKRIDSEIICMVVTAYVDVDTALKAIKNGAYDYMRKPLVGEELLAAMDRCFKLIKLEQGNREAEKSILIQNRELENINKRLKDTVISSTRFNEYTDYHELMDSILKEFRRIFPGSQSRQFMISPPDRQIIEMVPETRDSRLLDDFSWDQPFVETILKGESFILDNLRETKDDSVRNLFRYEKGALLVVPLTGKDFATIGYISLYNPEVNTFSRYDREIANILASVSSSSIRSLKTNEELKETEYRYSQSQKLEALGRLAGGIAHDFNNLLSAILGYTELLCLKLEDNADASAKLAEIRKAIHHGSSLTSQLLSFSRRDNLPKNAIDMNSLLNETSKIFKILLGVDNYLELDLEKNTCSIKGDADQIKQVLINLVINARDAMEGYGNKLRISTRIKQLNKHSLMPQYDVKPGPYLELCVSDSGSGMDNETLTQIFDPFFTTKEQGKGTGLGLSTVFGIIHRIDGYITVKSLLAKGTDFYIYLPLFETEPQDSTRTKTIEKAPFRKINGNILFVEDDNRIRGSIVESFKRLGLKVLEAENGEQGLLIFNKTPHSFDLIITDIIMPRMNGDKFAEEVLNINPSQKIIYMSGYTTDSLFDNKKINACKSNFLQKPFSNETLLNMVQNHLSGD